MRISQELGNSSEIGQTLQLLESERRYYQDIVAAVPVGLVIVSSDGKIVSSNHEARRILGLHPADPLPATIGQLFPPDAVAHVKQVLQAGAALTGLTTLLLSDPSRKLRIHLSRVSGIDPNSPAEALLAIEEPIAPPTDGPPAAELLDNLDAIVWAVDLQTRQFLYVNENAEELLGFPPSHWLSEPNFWTDRIHPADRDWVLAAYDKAVETSSRRTCEFRALTSFGETVWLRETIRLLHDPLGRSRHLLGFAADITQRHLIAAQSLHAERVRAGVRAASSLSSPIAELGAGLARHAGRLLHELDPDSPLRDAAIEIDACAHKLLSLFAEVQPTGQMALPGEPFDLCAYLEDRTQTLGQATRLQTSAALFPAPIGVHVDETQLDAVLKSLALALRDTGAKTLTLECCPAELEEATPSNASALSPGVYAVITLDADGAPLDRDAQIGLFDWQPGPAPLLQAYRRIRAWGGEISVAAKHPAGNLVKIYLPRMGEALRRPAKISQPPAPQPAPAQAVLLLENAEGIRTLMRKMLIRQSFPVMEASSADDAVKIGQENRGKIALLIAATSVPGIEPKTLKQIEKTNPGIRVLYLTGESGEPGKPAPAGAPFLEKPFTLGALLTKVRELTD